VCGRNAPVMILTLVSQTKGQGLELSRWVAGSHFQPHSVKTDEAEPVAPCLLQALL
jgi:hypothetical protein